MSSDSNGNEGADRERDDQELIDAEFDSMISGLNLDQSSPRTFLDELDELAQVEREEERSLYLPPSQRLTVRERISSIFNSIQRWWRNPHSDDDDGAVV